MKKQIEEMAKILLEMSCKGSECENCAFIRSVKEAEEACVCLKALYNAGYRKIPENARVIIDNPEDKFVVLTRDEYNELCCSIGVSREEVDRVVDMVEKDTRKETAEKFAERLKENTYNLIDFTGLVDTLVVDWTSIEEILKEITEDSNG